MVAVGIDRPRRVDQVGPALVEYGREPGGHPGVGLDAGVGCPEETHLVCGRRPSTSPPSWPPFAMRCPLGGREWRQARRGLPAGHQHQRHGVAAVEVLQ